MREWLHRSRGWPGYSLSIGEMSFEAALVFTELLELDDDAKEAQLEEIEARMREQAQ